MSSRLTTALRTVQVFLRAAPPRGGRAGRAARARPRPVVLWHVPPAPPRFADVPVLHARCPLVREDVAKPAAAANRNPRQCTVPNASSQLSVSISRSICRQRQNIRTLPAPPPPPPRPARAR